MEPFLLQIRNGKCTTRRIGAHTIAKVPSMIAMVNGLANPKEYTGHSLRRSSATALVESGADILTLKRHGRWQSDAVAEQYVSESVHHQVSVAKKICYGSEAAGTSKAVNINASTKWLQRSEGTRPYHKVPNLRVQSQLITISLNKILRSEETIMYYN